MDYNNLSEDDKNGIHEILFQMNIVGLNDNDKIEQYYKRLPIDIVKDGIRWGFNDSVVRDNMYEWFDKTINKK